MRDSPVAVLRFSVASMRAVCVCVCVRARARACVSGARINAEEGNRGERERPEKETGGRVHRESPGSDCFAEGQRVLAWHEKGCWDPATIVRHLPGNEKFRVAWADGVCMLHLCVCCLCNGVPPNAVHSTHAHRVEKYARTVLLPWKVTCAVMSRALSARHCLRHHKGIC